MSNSGVLVRFLPLLDVTLLLLGVVLLMLVSLAKNITEEVSNAKDVDQGTKAELGKLIGKEIIFLYAGWKDDQAGKCFQFNDDQSLGVAVDMAGGDWIKNPIGKGKMVALISEKGAWTAAWTPQRISKLEEKWNTKIVFFEDMDLKKVGL